MYVLQGTGVITEGGKLVGEKRTNAANMSGTSIEGGTAHNVSKGDVIIIPQNTPHQVNPTGGAPIVLMTFHVPARRAIGHKRIGKSDLIMPGSVHGKHRTDPRACGARLARHGLSAAVSKHKLKQGFDFPCETHVCANETEMKPARFPGRAPVLKGEMDENAFHGRPCRTFAQQPFSLRSARA